MTEPKRRTVRVELEEYKSAVGKALHLLEVGPCSASREVCPGCVQEWEEAVKFLVEVHGSTLAHDGCC